jgi:hypothetical protein
VRWRSIADFPPKYLGFIFCAIFSNLVATGCRRGRTPERPLRQPPKVWLIKPGPFSCSGRPRCERPGLRQKSGLTKIPVALHRLQRV